jgi:hypothetical protein
MTKCSYYLGGGTRKELPMSKSLRIAESRHRCCLTTWCNPLSAASLSLVLQLVGANIRVRGAGSEYEDQHLYRTSNDGDERVSLSFTVATCPVARADLPYR